MPTSNERKMLSSNEALKELKNCMIGQDSNNNKGEFLYSAHTMLCALHTYYLRYRLLYYFHVQADNVGYTMRRA